MREFDALSEYPQPTTPRRVGSELRTIQSRIVASYRGKEFYDGNRNNGYGGLHYDGRWKSIAKSMAETYNLTEKSKILQIGCDKGFLLHDFKEMLPNIHVCGLEVSEYAIEQSMPSIRSMIRSVPRFTTLPFEEKTFDFVLAIGAVYCLTLGDAISLLREITRVSRGNSFVTLASYETEEDFWLFRDWTVLGATLLKGDEWREVLRHVSYKGDYKLTSANTLNLIR